MLIKDIKFIIYSTKCENLIKNIIIYKILKKKNINYKQKKMENLKNM